MLTTDNSPSKTKYAISAVSYLNTKPFIYGLENTAIKNNIHISLDTPSKAAEKLLNDEVDIALVPIAIIPKILTPKIISPYCIGANGKVSTVLLLSDVSLDEIDTIYLDYQSRTSVQLIQILCKEFWKKKVFFARSVEGFENEIKNKKAGVIIGDRTIPLLGKYKYIIDLAEEWKKYTNLPFVFAVWLSKKEIDKDFLLDFNCALLFGLNNRDKIIKQYQHLNTPNFNVTDYLNNKIDYNFDSNKQKALNYFLGYMCAEDRCTIPAIQYIF